MSQINSKNMQILRRDWGDVKLRIIFLKIYMAPSVRRPSMQKYSPSGRSNVNCLLKNYLSKLNGKSGSGVWRNLIHFKEDRVHWRIVLISPQFGVIFWVSALEELLIVLGLVYHVYLYQHHLKALLSLGAELSGLKRRFSWEKLNMLSLSSCCNGYLEKSNSIYLSLDDSYFSCQNNLASFKCQHLHFLCWDPKESEKDGVKLCQTSTKNADLHL